MSIPLLIAALMMANENSHNEVMMTCSGTVLSRENHAFILLKVSCSYSNRDGRAQPSEAWVEQALADIEIRSTVLLIRYENKNCLVINKPLEGHLLPQMVPNDDVIYIRTGTSDENRQYWVSQGDDLTRISEDVIPKETLQSFVGTSLKLRELGWTTQRIPSVDPNKETSVTISELPDEISAKLYLSTADPGSARLSVRLESDHETLCEIGVTSEGSFKVNGSDQRGRG